MKVKPYKVMCLGLIMVIALVAVILTLKGNEVAQDKGVEVSLEKESNLIIQSEDENVATSDIEEEEDGSIRRTMPEYDGQSLGEIPNPNNNEKVTLKKL